MKKLFVLFFLIACCLQLNAQTKLFIRVYDRFGNKIKNGNIVGTTDSSLLFDVKGRDSVAFQIAYTKIGTIKTKHTRGHNVIIGTAIGAGFGIVGLLVSSGGADDTSGGWGGLFTITTQDKQVASIALIPLGAGIGFITGMRKKIDTFEINGNLEKWKAFQLYYQNKDAKNKGAEEATK